MNTYIKKLILTNYRVYENSVFEWTPNINIIYGENGIGKTNILEAISFLSAGRGFFNVSIVDVLKRESNSKIIPNNWVVRAEIENNINYDNISVYSEIENNNYKKKVKINNNLVRSQETLMKIFNIIYLIPEMQNLFIGEKENRRKFLDKIVYLIDTEHAKRLAKYEYLIKERIRILQEKLIYNENWVSIIERKISENAVAIASARNNIIYELNNIINECEFNFPKFILLIDGTIENMILKNKNAIDIENEFKEILKKNREIDKESKRTNEGVHKSDLKLFYQKKNIYAEDCSTGEQKLFLISLTILKALLCKKKNKATPIILLDEIFSYLDKTKKIDLFNELQKLNYQTFITSTDISIFDNLITKNINTLNLNKYNNLKNNIN